jgi:hypothetical protein
VAGEVPPDAVRRADPLYPKAGLSKVGGQSGEYLVSVLD